MKPFLSLILFLFLAAEAAPQDRRPLKRSTPVTTQTATTKDGRTVLLRSDGTWEYSTDPPISTPEPSPVLLPSPTASAELSTLNLEAAIVYGVGGAQPVARTDFSLLDKSLPDVLRDAGLRAGQRDAESNARLRQKFPSMPDFSRASPPRSDTDDNLLSDFGLAAKYPENSPQFLATAINAIKQHTTTTGTTDFTGKVELARIKPGEYYVVGLAQTRKGFAIWNVQISLKAGSNVLILDQRNATVAF